MGDKFPRVDVLQMLASRLITEVEGGPLEVVIPAFEAYHLMMAYGK